MQMQKANGFVLLVYGFSPKTSNAQVGLDKDDGPSTLQYIDQDRVFRVNPANPIYKSAGGLGAHDTALILD